VVPQMDAPTTQTYQPAPRPSFSDRITSCLDEAVFTRLRQSIIADLSNQASTDTETGKQN
jgi:hypothetical protein